MTPSCCASAFRHERSHRADVSREASTTPIIVVIRRSKEEEEEEWGERTIGVETPILPDVGREQES
ncbi:hypothetical protein ACHAW5_000016 [Stephanodiscus triporus]|uniref:Uncharacterized protein n=1 Tax=Stephanodiscus triporus TaxID=2934178 RepID=A0ABD3MZ36_9STRA